VVGWFPVCCVVSCRTMHTVEHDTHFIPKGRRLSWQSCCCCYCCCCYCSRCCICCLIGLLLGWIVKAHRAAFAFYFFAIRLEFFHAVTIRTKAPRHLADQIVVLQGQRRQLVHIVHRVWYCTGEGILFDRKFLCWLFVCLVSSFVCWLAKERKK